MFSSRCALTTKYSPAFTAEPFEHGRTRRSWPVVRQDLEHGAAGLDHPVRRQALAKQILARDIAVGQVDVADMIDDVPVDFLGHPLVEAAVTGLHVEDGYLASFGGNRRQATVGIAQNQQRVGLYLASTGHGLMIVWPIVSAAFARPPPGNNRASDRRDRRRKSRSVRNRSSAPCAQAHGRQYSIEPGDDPGQADDLGPGSDDGHDLNFFICEYLAENRCRALSGSKISVGPEQDDHLLIRKIFDMMGVTRGGCRRLPTLTRTPYTR